MAHFYGGVHGHRGEATRLGTARSGLSVFGNGWSVGVRAQLDAHEDAPDTVTIYLTSGSSGTGQRFPLGTFTKDDLARMIAEANTKTTVPA